MKISYKGDYALKAMLDLALHYDKDLLTNSDLAKHIDAPIKFLEQVLVELKKGGFVQSRRGNIGGYKLSREPSNIILGDIVRYIDGPIEPIACLKDKYSDCADIKNCVFKKIWERVHTATTDIIDHISLKQLVDEVHQSQRIISYSI